MGNAATTTTTSYRELMLNELVATDKVEQAKFGHCSRGVVLSHDRATMTVKSPSTSSSSSAPQFAYGGVLGDEPLSLRVDCNNSGAIKIGIKAIDGSSTSFVELWSNGKIRWRMRHMSRASFIVARHCRFGDGDLLSLSIGTRNNGATLKLQNVTTSDAYECDIDDDLVFMLHVQANHNDRLTLIDGRE